MKYQPTIGIEIHLQLATESKMFCDCLNSALQDRPNSFICPICTGQPGALPVLNQKAIEMILKLGLALNGQVQKKFYFERKNYFYPDLPKGYQISQKRSPVIKNAALETSNKKIKIEEMHLEEDTAKIYHQANETAIDFNRAGAPLIEIVSAPEIETARQAREYCEEIQAIARALKISNANMEKGEMRCEVNISLREIADKRGYQRKSASTLGTKVEVKNLNSFRAVERAIEYEIKRQERELERGGEIIQETRGWDEKNNTTVSQRIKEEAEDYRYFPEPDLPIFEIKNALIEKIEQSLPELPSKKRRRLSEEHGFSQHHAKILTGNEKVLNFVEETMDFLKSKISESEEEEIVDQQKIAKKLGDWIINKLFGLETSLGGKFYQQIKAVDFSEFMFFVLSRRIFSNQLAENILKKMYQTGESAETILTDHSMAQADDQEELKKAIELVLENYPEAIADYKKGKKNAIKYLLGQVMAATKGRAEPKKIEKMLQKFLE